jgi:hypothetical protein
MRDRGSEPQSERMAIEPSTPLSKEHHMRFTLSSKSAICGLIAAATASAVFIAPVNAEAARSKWCNSSTVGQVRISSNFDSGGTISWNRDAPPEFEVEVGPDGQEFATATNTSPAFEVHARHCVQGIVGEPIELKYRAGYWQYDLVAGPRIGTDTRFELGREAGSELWSYVPAGGYIVRARVVSNLGKTVAYSKPVTINIKGQMSDVERF